MPGLKTNEREGTRAVLRYARLSSYKVREVLDVIRNKPVHEAADLLRFVERDAAAVVGKLLNSAVANAVNNDGADAEELYVSACFADEGPTVKRWRPRARGRATRIRKRSCHVTIIVSRLPEDRLARLQARRRAENLAMRSRRVEATRRARAESAEGASRRERRHPEAFAAPEEAEEETTAEAATGEEGAAEPSNDEPEEQTTADEAAADGAAVEEPVVDESAGRGAAQAEEDQEAAKAEEGEEAVGAADADKEKDS